ncbi:EpsD family peptidyl-prolyl cis-trans isomerase [Roseiarcus sp.]|uniref:EpsD family peptidyl-prolyl cis-trans isomerase n=1 Tax=Roseiarcus sp. TaxID=1969460 RepID=UPI003F96C0EE
MLQVSRLTHGGWRIAAVALALIGAVALSGCGKKEESSAVVGQVIAHVGPDDITQQELDNEFRLANVPADKRSDDVIKAILSRIVERKYLVQQAIAAKLDREPTVHLDLLRSREQILAGAYVQRDLGTKVTGIAKNEIDNYIQGHPDQFGKRQVYNIEQVSFPPVKDMEALSAATKDFKTIDQVEAKLNELGMKYSRGPGALDSATMPAQMLGALQARKPDDVFFIRSRNNASFFKVTSVEDKPLTGDDAQNLGKRELANEIAKRTGEDASKAALAATKFEGDYARIMATATPAAPAAGGEASPAETPTVEKPGEEQKKD